MLLLSREVITARTVTPVSEERQWGCWPWLSLQGVCSAVHSALLHLHCGFT